MSSLGAHSDYEATCVMSKQALNTARCQREDRDSFRFRPAERFESQLPDWSNLPEPLVGFLLKLLQLLLDKIESNHAEFEILGESAEDGCFFPVLKLVE